MFDVERRPISGTYPALFTAAMTAFREASRTPGRLLSTRETVVIETPACFAMSRMLAIVRLLEQLLKQFHEVSTGSNHGVNSKIHTRKSTPLHVASDFDFLPPPVSTRRCLLT